MGGVKKTIPFLKSLFCVCQGHIYTINSCVIAYFSIGCWIGAPQACFHLLQTETLRTCQITFLHTMVRSHSMNQCQLYMPDIAALVHMNIVGWLPELVMWKWNHYNCVNSVYVSFGNNIVVKKNLIDRETSHVFFLKWIFKFCRNLLVLKQDTEYTKSSSVLNFYEPYEIKLWPSTKDPVLIPNKIFMWTKIEVSVMNRVKETFSIRPLFQ